jgi:hypothetical protein
VAQAALFGQAHARMLRALYPAAPTPATANPPGQNRGPQAGEEEEEEEIWQRVQAFLADAGGLMALRVELLASRAAEPWTAPLPFQRVS